MLMSKEDMPVMTSGADSTSTSVELVRTPIGLGLTIDSQYKVLALAKDGQAERSRGIAVGDQLVSMNGVPLSGGGAFDAFDEQLGAIPMGTKVTLVISKPAGSAKDRISQISVPTASADSPPPPSLPPADNRGQHSTVIHDDFDGKDIVVTISDSTEGTAPQNLPDADLDGKEARAAAEAKAAEEARAAAETKAAEEARAAAEAKAAEEARAAAEAKAAEEARAAAEAKAAEEARAAAEAKAAEEARAAAEVKAAEEARAAADVSEPSEAQLHIVVTASDSTEGTAPQDLPAVLAACGLEHLTSAFEAEKYTLKTLLAAMKEGDRAAMRDLHELGLNLGESRKLINQLKKASK